LDEFVCITVLARPGESQADFSGRLSHFWTHMLRTRLADFEKVYAESSAFAAQDQRWSRQYLAEVAVIAVLAAEFTAAGVEFVPIDRDDIYSRYEAVAPEWMQIEH
jgi:hypothetical protein